jgi:RNA polymerase sporulation-specific sigma factor
MISVVTSTKRLKHKVLNDSISYDVDIDGVSFDKILKDDESNPEKIILNLNEQEILTSKINEKLTGFEKEVFELMVSNFTYKEIAVILDKDSKQIDNAIQRIKNKVKKIDLEVMYEK